MPRLFVKSWSAVSALSAGGAFAITSVLGAAAPATAATSAIFMSRTVHVSSARVHAVGEAAAPGWVAAFRQVRSGLGQQVAVNQAARHEAEQKAAARAAAAAKAAAARATAARAASGDPRGIAKSMLGQFGWSTSQFSSLNQLWWHESGWSVTAQNPGSGAYGIPQALSGSTMASAGPDWKTNPATQIKWGLTYIKDRYGSPDGAWSHEQSSGWY